MKKLFSDVVSTIGKCVGKVSMVRSHDNPAHEIWHVTDSKRLASVRTVNSAAGPVIEADIGVSGTDKSWWEYDTGIAYIGL